jgi:hypothetical protein
MRVCVDSHPVDAWVDVAHIHTHGCLSAYVMITIITLAALAFLD